MQPSALKKKRKVFTAVKGASDRESTQIKPASIHSWVTNVANQLHVILTMIMIIISINNMRIYGCIPV